MATGMISKYTDGTTDDWQTLSNPNNLYTGTIKYKRIGDFVYVLFDQVYLVTALTTGSRAIDTLPSGYRPSKVIYFNSSPYSGGVGTISINTSGTITLYRPPQSGQILTTDNLAVSTMFIR